MQNKRTTRAWAWARVALAGLLALLAVAAPAGAGESLRRAPRALAAAAETQPELTGDYVGTVDLAYSLPGVFTDPLPAPNPLPAVDLGQIDFGLVLAQVGATVTGHVELTTTLVFSGHVGLTGSLSGAEVTLTSEVVPHQTAAGQTLERQFRLVGALDADNVLKGEYRETVWGYGPQPFTMVGSATLLGPTSQGPAPLAAQLQASATVGVAPFTVSFTDRSSGQPTGWQWTFGDGGTSTEQHPQHTYTVPGAYTVSLTVTEGEQTDTQTRTGYITVLEAWDRMLVLPLIIRR